MKHFPHLTSQLLAASFVTLGLPATAATYYVNSFALSTTYAGTSTSKPWKTLSKVNSTAKSGDTVYLATGSVWNETLVVKSGITYASYKTTATAKPIIDGAKPLGALTTWTVSEGNTYKTTLKNVTTTGLGQLYLYSSNGVVTRLQRARHPNVGQGAWGAGSRYARIADSGQAPAIDALPIGTGALPSKVTSNNLVGADAYVRIDNYEFVKYRVTGNVGDVLKTKRRSLDPMLPDMDSVPGDVIDQKDPAVTYNTLRIAPGWGYWLENQAWMLDSPGEWYHDTATNTLYVQMPNGKTPKGQTLNATVLASGITGTGVGNVIIRDIEVRDTRGDGIALEGLTANGLIERVDVNRAGGKGIAVTNSTGGNIKAVAVRDSIMQGVWMGDFRYPGTKAASEVHLRDSTISQAGRGYYALSAVMLGNGSQATGNTIEGSSAFGIHGWRNNLIEKNAVLNSCMEFDDCGAIYVIGRGEFNTVGAYALGTNILQNVVMNVPGSADGRLYTGSSTKGIYLDDFSEGVGVSNNVVSNADVGYMLHFARDVTLSGNTSFGNRFAELWMQENLLGKNPETQEIILFDCNGRPNCDAYNYLQGNTISGNTFASENGSPVILQTSEYSTTSDFATFSNNRYVSTASESLVIDETPGNQAFYPTLLSWQALGKDVGSTHYRAVAGYQLASGASNQLIRNADFASGNDNWFCFNCTASVPTGHPTVRVLSGAADAAVDAAGRKTFVMHSLDDLSITPGKLYMAAFEARSSQANDSSYFAIRRKVSPWDNLSTTGGDMALATSNKTFYRILQAMPGTQGVAGRLDLEFLAKGDVQISGLRMYEVSKRLGSESSLLLTNPTPASVTKYCPALDTALCSRYVNASNGLPVTFPVNLPAYSGMVGTLTNSPWLDSDNDTVPNVLDICSNSDFARYGSTEFGCGPDL